MSRFSDGTPFPRFPQPARVLFGELGAEVPLHHHNGLPQLFFADEVPTATAIGLLEARQATLQAELDVLARRTPSLEALEAHLRDPETPPAWRMHSLTLHYGLTHLRFQIDWLKSAAAMIRAGDDPPAPEESPPQAGET